MSTFYLLERTLSHTVVRNTYICNHYFHLVSKSYNFSALEIELEADLKMAERQMHAMALLVHKLICDGEYIYVKFLIDTDLLLVLYFNFGKSNSTLMCMILCNRIMTLPSCKIRYLSRRSFQQQ